MPTISESNPTARHEALDFNAGSSDSSGRRKTSWEFPNADPCALSGGARDGSRTPWRST